LAAVFLLSVRAIQASEARSKSSPSDMALLSADEQAIAVASLRNSWSDIGMPEAEAEQALTALCAELRLVLNSTVEREQDRKEALQADERAMRSELTSLAAALGEEAALGASAGQPPLLAWRSVAAEAERLRAARTERWAAREATASHLHAILIELSGGTAEENRIRSTPPDAHEPKPDAPGGLTLALIDRLQTRLVRVPTTSRMHSLLRPGCTLLEERACVPCVCSCNLSAPRLPTPNSRALCPGERRGGSLGAHGADVRPPPIARRNRGCAWHARGRAERRRRRRVPAVHWRHAQGALRSRGTAEPPA
jgi:hypothetical protein